jgi:hypothetical protein
MRLRVGVSCATITCAGAAMATAASCVSTQNPPGPAGLDASFTDAAVLDTGIVPPLEDAGSDAAPLLLDSATAEAAFDAGCSPRAGFQPLPYVPFSTATGSLACLGLPLQKALAADCFDDASTYATCAGFADAGIDGGPNTGLCLGCLVTPENSDAGYGPVIRGVVPTLNVAGCIQFEDETDAGYTCASAVQAAWACTEYACASSCPVSDATSRAAYVACTQLAATGVCSTYTAQANGCVAAELEGGAGPDVMVCFDGANDAGQALTLLDFFCGT